MGKSKGLLLISASALLFFLLVSNRAFDKFFAMSYPAQYQKSYQLFVDKCSQCHTLDVAKSVDSYLPSNWEDVVDRMRHKPDAKISEEEGKEIYQFLVYDSTVNHKKQLDEELKALSPDRKAAEEKKIEEAQQ